MAPFDPLGIGLMQRAQDRRSQWDFSHNRTLLPGEIEDTQANPMGVAPHMASFDMLPQYLNEVGEDANAQGLKYRTSAFQGNNTPSMLGLRSATKRNR